MAKIGRPTEWTEERIKVEAKALLEWSLSPRAWTLEGFCTRRDEPYTRKQMHLICEKSEAYLHAFLIAKDRIRQNREEACAAGDFNTGVYQKTCTFYDRKNAKEEQSLACHFKDMDRAKRDAIKDDTIDTLKSANDAIQGTVDDAK